MRLPSSLLLMRALICLHSLCKGVFISGFQGSLFPFKRNEDKAGTLEPFMGRICNPPREGSSLGGFV